MVGPRMDLQRCLRLARRTLDIGLLFLLVALGVPPAPTGAQTVRVVRDPPLCTPGGLKMETTLRLGDREGPGRVMPPNATGVDSRGNFYLAHGDGGSQVSMIWVFSPEGEFLRTIGKKGEGPGEFLNIARLDLLAGDTLEVYDERLRRRTVFSPNGTVISTGSFDVRTFSRSLRLPDGRLVVNEHIQTPERVGYPLQLVSPEGKVERSFGSLNPQYSDAEPLKVNKLVFAGHDPELIRTIGRGDYLIELWDTLGNRMDGLRRETDWFVPRSMDREISVTGPGPPGILRYAKVDTQGRIWIIGLAAKRDWRGQALADPDFRKSALAFMNLFHSIVEVVDPVTGELVVSELIPGQTLAGFIGDDHILVYKDDEDGYPYLEVVRISVSCPPRAPTN